MEVDPAVGSWLPVDDVAAGSLSLFGEDQKDSRRFIIDELLGFVIEHLALGRVRGRLTEPDQLVDDQAAFVETPVGTVVVLGCAHAGVINTLRHVQALTDNRPIYMAIGGMHLLNASPERMDKTVAELRRLDVKRLLPCHCTGMAAVARLWQEFPGRCGACPVGTIVEVPA